MMLIGLFLFPTYDTPTFVFYTISCLGVILLLQQARLIIRARVNWPQVWPIALIIIALIPILTWGNFYVDGRADGFGKMGQILLPIVATAIILLTLLLKPDPNFCFEQGFLRIVIFVRDDPSGDKLVSGQVMGEGTNRYCTQGYKIILYAKTDIWCLESNAGQEIRLADDGAWQAVSGYRQATMYIAFLARKDYVAPRFIGKITLGKDDLPPLAVDGDQIIAWMPWSVADDPAPTRAEDKAIHWLKQQITPNKIVPYALADRAGLILSYQIPQSDELYLLLGSRSWIYDNALAAIVLIAWGDLATAFTILSALAGQIEADGKPGFVYDTRTDWFGEDYRSDAIAWVGYAFVFYQQETGHPYFQAIAQRIARYLLTLQDSNPTSPCFGSIRANAADVAYVTDHNIIAYFFLRDLGRLLEDEDNQASRHADLIKASLRHHHWNETKGRFDQKIGDVADGLVEVTSLGALFCLAIDDADKVQRSLDFAEQTYRTVVLETSRGYAPYKDKTTIWSQGTLQIALAYQRLGEVERSEALINEIIDWQMPDGGIAYARPKMRVMTGEDYPAWPSVAGTAWLMITRLKPQRFLDL